MSQTTTDAVESDARIIELETKFAHQDLALEELQNALFAQQKRIDELEKSLKTFRERIEGVFSGENEIGPGDQKPPHY